MNPDATRKRRTPAEIQQLVSEFLSSGLRRSEFCRQHHLSFDTLQRYLKQQATTSNAMVPASPLLPVQLSSLRRSSPPDSGLALALGNGWKIEIACGFDPATLGRLLSVVGQR